MCKLSFKLMGGYKITLAIFSKIGLPKEVPIFVY
jgi:hypothetical protein